jgi:flagellar basal body-associated protein FliL
MSETSTPAPEETAAEQRRAAQQRSATRQAIIVVLALTLIAALVIIEFAFSTANDSQSVDGPTATSSQYVD